MTATTQTRPAGADRRAVPSVLRQTLRLTRVEFTLFYRYRVAAFYAMFPLLFAVLFLGMPDDELLPGVGVAALAAAGMVTMAPMMIAIFHIPNVLAARRETMILKRFRVSGTAPSALFGAIVLSVVGTGLAVGVAIAVLGNVVSDLGTPRDPVMVLVGVVLGGVIVSLLAASLTRLARNAESAQMMTVVPFFAIFALSGVMIPLDILPEAVQVIPRLLPIAPMVDMVTSGWFGYDFFGGREGAETASVGALWVSALPALLVGAVWLVITTVLLRGFRWDPREAK